MAGPIKLEGRCVECLLFGAIQGMDEGLVLVDLQGKVFHVNRRAEMLLGVASARALGNRLDGFLKHRGLLALWASAARESDPVSADLTLAPSLPVRATVSICRSAADEPIGRALLLRDVSREKSVQIELSAAVARRLVDLAGGEEPSDLAALTRRERQVLAFLSSGLGNAAIGKKLNVSPHTIASHLKHLYAKIDVRNRAQAVAYALARGIRPPGK